MLVEPFIPFLLFALAMYATPGPATLSILASGAAFGFKNTVIYIGGLISGLLSIFFMVALGLGLLFSQYPTVHLIFKWVSFVYILYLAYKIMMASSIHASKSQRIGFLQGVGLNMLNPKAYFAVIATVSQFTKPGEEYYVSFGLLTLWVVIIALSTNLVWAYTGSIVGSKLGSSKYATFVNYFFALLLVASVLLVMFLE